MTIKLAIASDHAGFEAKSKLVEALQELDWIDLGTRSEERVDYPDIAQSMANTIRNAEGPSMGILLCGTGIGVSIAANRFKGIRAANVCTTEQARLAKEHNDANVLCLGARTTPLSEHPKLVKAWLEASFAGGRHARRVEKIEKGTLG